MSDGQHTGHGTEGAQASRGIDPSWADRYVEPDIYADIDIEGAAPAPPARAASAAPASSRPTSGDTAALDETRVLPAEAAPGPLVDEEAAPEPSSADVVPAAAPAPAPNTARSQRAARNTRRRRLTLAGVVLLVLAALLALLIPQFFRAPEPNGWTNHTQQPSVAPEGAAPGEQQDAGANSDAGAEAPADDGAQAPAPGQPLTLDQTSPDSLTVLVNKLHPLEPSTYEPSDLVDLSTLGVSASNGHPMRSEAATALAEMFAAARAAGYELDMTSGYRPYATQEELYNGFVSSLGQEGADLTSARPGYSEHQTGLVADISEIGGTCALATCFGDTGAGAWLAEHSWEYGFILRYPNGQTEVTGYEYEPWHFRYIGREAATSYRNNGATSFESFLGSTPAPDYAS